jgi:hypothetical protein
MDCLKCRSLDRIFRKQLVLYLEARSTPFYWVSPKLAARQRVDMERAKNDMEEHLFICAEAGQMSHAGIAANPARAPYPGTTPRAGVNTAVGSC